MRRRTPALALASLLLLAVVAPSVLSGVFAQASSSCAARWTWRRHHRCHIRVAASTPPLEVAAPAITVPPTTEAPVVTEPPTTEAPTTVPPTTEAPIAIAPPPTDAPDIPPPAAPPAALGSFLAGWTSFIGPMTEYTTGLHPTEAGQLIQRVSIIDSSGDASVQPDQNGYNGYTLDTFRIHTREGPRAAGAPITLNNGYIEVKAQAGDHADGVQFYGGGGATITNTKILTGGDGATAIFAADDSHGTITLDGDYFGALPGANRPGFLVRINADGADRVIVRNSVFECGAAANADIAIASNLIVEWTNVHCTDGRVINKP